jgi:hypothetical protein
MLGRGYGIFKELMLLVVHSVQAVVRNLHGSFRGSGCSSLLLLLVIFVCMRKSVPDYLA